MTGHNALAIDGPYHRESAGESRRPAVAPLEGELTMSSPGQPEPPPGPNRKPSSKADSTDLPSSSELILARLERDGGADNRRFRQFLVAALVIHAIALVVTLPTLQPPEIMNVGKPAKVFVMQQPKYKKPPAPPARQEQPTPKVKAKRIPIPDPTPDEPEPIELELPVVPEIDLAEITEVTFGIPDAPPATDGTGLSGPQEFTGDAMEVGAGVARPVGIHRPQPLYTEAARQSRIQGVVILQGIVDEQGLVQNLSVVKGLPLGLAQSALDTVATWRYKPAVYQGRAVAVRMHFTVNFTVQ